MLREYLVYRNEAVLIESCHNEAPFCALCQRLVDWSAVKVCWVALFTTTAAMLPSQTLCKRGFLGVRLFSYPPHENKGAVGAFLVLTDFVAVRK
jgi:hypothetical protein